MQQFPNDIAIHCVQLMLLILLGHRMLTEGLDVSVFARCHVVECVAERASVTALLINNLKDSERQLPHLV